MIRHGMAQQPGVCSSSTVAAGAPVAIIVAASAALGAGVTLLAVSRPWRHWGRLVSQLQTQDQPQPHGNCKQRKEDDETAGGACSLPFGDTDSAMSATHRRRSTHHRRSLHQARHSVDQHRRSVDHRRRSVDRRRQSIDWHSIALAAQAAAAAASSSSGVRPSTPSTEPLQLTMNWDDSSSVVVNPIALAQPAPTLPAASSPASRRSGTTSSGDTGSAAYSLSAGEQACSISNGHINIQHQCRRSGSYGSLEWLSSASDTELPMSISCARPSISFCPTDLGKLPLGFSFVDFSQLELARLIGEGSFGQVWLAKYCQTTVAVKILVERGIPTSMQVERHMRQLVKEAGLMAMLRHPNVCQYLGACLEPPCIIMEYCPRKSLDALLASAKSDPRLAKQLPWARLLSMACDAAKGILYLHSHNPPVAHRDLKTPNLLVDGQWHVKVADFNLSRPLEQGVAVSTVGVTNPRWLAPCVLAGQPAGLPADIWGFGTVMWELMTWMIPFEDLNPFQIIGLVQKTGCSSLAIPPPEELPAGPFGGYDEYVALMKECWAQEPADRPCMDHVAKKMRGLLAAELESQSATKLERSQAVVLPQHTPFTLVRSTPLGAVSGPTSTLPSPFSMDHSPRVLESDAVRAAPQMPAMPTLAMQRSGPGSRQQCNTGSEHATTQQSPAVSPWQMEASHGTGTPAVVDPEKLIQRFLAAS